MDYDQLREVLVNSENLYSLWQSTGQDEEDFIRMNASLIEETKKNRLAKEKTKARQVKFIERQKEAGRRTLTAIVSSKTYDHLCRQRDRSQQRGEKKSLGQILDELLSGPGQGQDSQKREDPIKAIAGQIMQDIEDHVQEYPSTIETQKKLFNDQDQDKPDIIKIMAEYRAAGDTWPIVVEKLNNQGIPAARGGAWTKANAQTYYSRKTSNAN